MFQDEEQQWKTQRTVFMVSNSLKYDSFCWMLSARSTSSDCRERKQQTTVDTIWHDSLISVQSEVQVPPEWSNPHLFVNISSKNNRTKICSVNIKSDRKTTTRRMLLYSDKLLSVSCCSELDSEFGICSHLQWLLWVLPQLFIRCVLPNSEQLRSLCHTDSTDNSTSFWVWEWCSCWKMLNLSKTKSWI